MEESLTPLPDWFAPLCQEIAHELDALEKTRQDHRPALEQETMRLRACIQGWSVSLAKPDLNHALREDIETQYAQALTRLREMEALLAELEMHNTRRDQLVDPRKVLDRLRRLDEILASGNVTMGNLELAHHIDRIDVYPDQRVVMRTSKLGIFDGAVAELARADIPAPTEEVGPQVNRIRPRQRGPMRVDEIPTAGTDLVATTKLSAKPDRFANLDRKWFWEDDFEMPRRSCWAADHAAEVARLRNEGWTMARLASHFGRTPPTIRRALKLATEQGQGRSNEPPSQL
jgi:hypothetical protein